MGKGSCADITVLMTDELWDRSCCVKEWSDLDSQRARGEEFGSLD